MIVTVNDFHEITHFRLTVNQVKEWDFLDKVQYRLNPLSLYYTFSKAHQEFYWMIKLQSRTAEELLENETGIQ